MMKMKYIEFSIISFILAPTFKLPFKLPKFKLPFKLPPFQTSIQTSSMVSQAKIFEQFETFFFQYLMKTYSKDSIYELKTSKCS